MKLVTINSAVCSIFIIAAAQTHGILYNSFITEKGNAASAISAPALIIPVSGIGMIAVIYLYQMIASAKNNFIRTNNFIFVLMAISALMMIYPLPYKIFNIRIIDKIYEITGLYIFSNTPSMYISFMFSLLFFTQLYVYRQKNKYAQ